MFSFNRVVRLWIPAIIVVACVVVLAISPDENGLEAAGLLFGGGAAIVVVNEIQRVGFAGDIDRSKEEETRVFYRRYGLWPGQASDDVIEQARRDGLLEHVVVRRPDGREV